MALVYESFLVFAVLFISSLLFSGAPSAPLTGWSRHAFQLYLFLTTGFYFLFCWLRGGQTLAMKTWKLRLISSTGATVTAQQALLRYLLSWISLLAAGAGFLWALVDKEGLFLHDRLSGTRIVRCS
jgi:uncharacterized RDD family membrane protein YckC